MNMIADTFHLNVFKSAADLNITDEQRDALVATLELLDTKQLIHISEDAEWDFMDWNAGNRKPAFFNMEVWGGLDGAIVGLHGRCGTVCCLGGTAELLAGKRLFHNASGQLYALFYDFPDGDSISTEAAATVLRHYLTTGEADWSLVCEDYEEASDDGDL